MVKKITPEASVSYLKVTISLCFTWPLRKDATKFQVVCFKTLRFLLCVNATILILPMIYTLYKNEYDLPKMTKIWCLLGAFTQIVIEVSLCAMQHDRFQYLVSVMEHDFKHSEEHERIVYQRYTDKCLPFYASATLVVFLTAFLIGIIAPMTPDQTFPTEAQYPFDVESGPLKYIIFVHQFIVVWQCFSTVCLCNFVSFFIWFTAARFEILCQRFRTVNSTCELIACINHHNKLLRYAQEVIIAIRSTLLSKLIICTWAILASGLTIVSPSTLADKTHFMVVCLTGLMEVFAIAWPADYLMDASANVAQAAYESPWYNQSVSYQKNILYILLRSQQPVIVSVSSIIPALSLSYYASYVSTAFSYLMTLRIVFVEGK